MRPIVSGFRRRLAPLGWLSTLLTLLVGCEREEPPPPDSLPMPTGDSISAPSAPDEGELVFDREFLFLSLEADSLVIVPWFFRASVTPDGVHREQTAWLSPGGEWELLGQEIRDTPPTRSPWRILPGTTIRLIVGPDDRVESLLLRDPPRELETVLGNLMTEWGSPGAESIRLYRGRTLFPAGPIEGIVIEVSHRWEASDDRGPGRGPGDWVFVHSGSDLQFFMEGEHPVDPRGAQGPSVARAAGPIEGIVIEVSRRWEASDDRGPGDWVFVHSGSDLQFFMEGEHPVYEPGVPVRYDGWTRVALRDLQWQELAMEWDELRAYESARRDVPIRWSIGAPGEEVSGSLESVSSHLMVGQSDGPILPVLGLFEVSGVMEVQGQEFSVAGMIRHVQR